MTRSTSTHGRRIAVAGLAVVVATAIVVPFVSLPAAAANGFNTTQAPSTTIVTPGATVDLTVRLRNASADSNSVALDVDPPGGWSVVAQSSTPAATFRSSAVQWLWLAPPAPDATTFVVNYTVQVPAGAADGPYAIEAMGNFNNGTATWSNATSTVVVDSAPPTIANATASDDRDDDDAVADGDEVSLSANVSDAGSGVATVTANASAFGAGTVSLTDPDGDGEYRSSFVVDEGSAGPDGSYAVEITATDASGREVTAATNPITLDTAGPAIANAAATDADGDGNVTGGDQVTLSADVSDATTAVDAVSADASALGAGTVALADADGDGTYDATVTVNASTATDGVTAVAITATDTVGNANSSATNALLVDTTGPTIANASAVDAGDGDTSVTGGDTVSVTAEVADAGVGVDRVAADATAFGAGIAELTDPDGDGTYAATFVVNASRAAPNGSYAIPLAANDTLNNTNTGATNPLALNTTPAAPPATTTTTTTTTTTVETVSTFLDGFQPVTAIVALVLVVLLGLRRRE